MKLLKPNLASFPPISTDTTKHQRCQCSTPTEISCCPLSRSLTLVPQIYAKCQVLLTWVSQICHFLFIPISGQLQSVFALNQGTNTVILTSASKFSSNLSYTAPQTSLSNLLSFYASDFQTSKSSFISFLVKSKSQCPLQSGPGYFLIKPENLKTGSLEIMQMRKLNEHQKRLVSYPGQN